jgi:23S rRNA (adenine2503-C2)-methyltransferase
LKINLLGVLPSALVNTLAEAGIEGIPPYRVRQISAWLAKGAASFEVMTDIPPALRAELAEKFILRDSTVEQSLSSRDGSIKLRLALADGNRVEAVILRDGVGRATACLSTQAGCPMGCVFCKTGSLGFSRNLTTAEIMEEYWALRAALQGQKPQNLPPLAGGIRGGGIDNIVFMGMGEPLLNMDALLETLSILHDSLGMSERRITVSTCGIAKGIRCLADKAPGVRLAVSLVTADEELRRGLLPGAEKNTGLTELKDALLYWQAKTGSRLTLEAALLAGLNDGIEQSTFLKRFIKGLSVMLNIIPWNPASNADGPLSFNGKPLARPSPEAVSSYMEALRSSGITAELRREKGGQVQGACGQLGVVR